MFNQDRNGDQRVTVLKNGRWFLTGFIPFQYGVVLNLQNKVHKSIYHLLLENEVKMTSIRPQLEVTIGVKDKDKEKAKDKDKDKDKDIYKEIITYFNTKTGQHYKHTTQKTRTVIDTRTEEGFTIDDFKVVIDKKVKEWLHTDMAKYLRPETLFGTKFEGYLNQQAGSTLVGKYTMQNLQTLEETNKEIDDDTKRQKAIK